MGREIRRVPEGWEHPKDANGHYQPLYDATYLARLKNIVRHELPYYLRHPRHLRELFECLPDRAYCRPGWRKGEATHYQIYENVSDGTPVSPVFATLGNLRTWLIDEGYSYKAIENFVKYGYALSMVMSQGKIAMGIHSAEMMQ